MQEGRRQLARRINAISNGFKGSRPETGRPANIDQPRHKHLCRAPNDYREPEVPAPAQP